MTTRWETDVGSARIGGKDGVRPRRTGVTNWQVVVRKELLRMNAGCRGTTVCKRRDGRVGAHRAPRHVVVDQGAAGVEGSTLRARRRCTGARRRRPGIGGRPVLRSVIRHSSRLPMGISPPRTAKSQPTDTQTTGHDYGHAREYADRLSRGTLVDHGGLGSADSPWPKNYKRRSPA